MKVIFKKILDNEVLALKNVSKGNLTFWVTIFL